MSVGPQDVQEANEDQAIRNKRKYDELAAKDLSRVFFKTISERLIIDAMPKVKHLKKVVEWMEARLEYYQKVSPSCVCDNEGTADDLYCETCNAALSCAVWKSNSYLRDCSNHAIGVECCECQTKNCSECVEQCPDDSSEYCPSCFLDHASDCRQCRSM